MMSIKLNPFFRSEGGSKFPRALLQRIRAAGLDYFAEV